MIEKKGARPKKILCIAVVGLLAVFAGGQLVWKHHFQHYTPVDALKDLRAAARLRYSTNRVQDFLELRYGPQTDPANRQKAIEDLFNAGHIEGLYLIVGNQTNAQARAVVANVAQTIADYRREMTPEEKAGLGAFFRSDAGRSQIQEATACYQAKDVRFRSVTTPVIGELLATLAATH
jgi:hypothetical protein